MSDLIFDSSAFGLVSNWVKGYDDDGPELASKDGEKLRGNTKKRMGLGARVQTQAKNEESVGQLQKLVMGRKRRRQEDEPNDIDVGHAMADVDEDDEGEVLESKARVFDRQRPATAVTLPLVTETVSEGVKKKRKKKSKKSHQATPDNAKAVQEQQPHAGATNATEKTGQPPEQVTKEESHPRVSKADGQRSARVEGGEQRSQHRLDDTASRPSEPSQSSAKASAEDKHKRQKHKTRSKQKNIRRDRRPEDKRPEHLRLGSSGFSGRILTEETKQKLGVGKE